MKKLQHPVARGQKKGPGPGPNYKNNTAPEKVEFSAWQVLYQSQDPSRDEGNPDALDVDIWIDVLENIETQDFRETSGLAEVVHNSL